jgi:hypothetical protein
MSAGARRPKIGPRIVDGLSVLADIAEKEIALGDADYSRCGDEWEDARRAIEWIDKMREWWPERKRREDRHVRT